MIGKDYIADKVREDLFPQGEEVERVTNRRKRVGGLWRGVFTGATIFAVVILSVLLLKIINDAMGLVAEETAISERELLLIHNESQVLVAPNVALSSGNDTELALGIIENPDGLGFISWSAYLANADRLKAVALDGQLPGPETVASGEYPLARPLYVYTSAAVLRQKPHVAAFLSYYLEHLDEVVAEGGYFAADEALLAEQAAALGESLPSNVNPADYEGDIVITGSTTVFPITQAVADRFVADGFRGTITVDPAGTSAGFRRFCYENDRSVDIVNASRAVLPVEYTACRTSARLLADFLVARDALSVVVNTDNQFVDDITRLELLHLFTTAENWSDVREEWPTNVIQRFVPTADSGTMDFFVETAFVTETLGDLSYDALVGIYTANVSRGRCRAVEREQRFFSDSLLCETEPVLAEACASDNPPGACELGARDSAQIVQLIQTDVIKPKVVGTWNALESILNREEILATVAQRYPNAEVYFKSWLSWRFITSPQSSFPEIAGIRTALFGTLWVVGIAVLVSFPLGVAAAVYLEEYADSRSRLNQIIQTNINNLAGVPSIIYGLLGLAVFVRALEPITSGALFGAVDSGATANGRTVLSAGLTLALLGLPVIIISSQEAIRAVPSSLRQASYGLGATRWQTVRSHVLPNAIGGILTGVILSMSRIIGETAPLVVVGASTFITTDPNGPFAKFTTLPSQIYQWTARPQDTYRDIAAATIVVLLILLFLLNATAIYLRNRYGKRLG